MKKIKSILANKNFRILSLALLVLAVGTLDADAQITNGLTQAAAEIKKYVPLVKNIAYALAAVVFIVGGVSIFIKMNNGEQDVKNSILMYVGGAMFLLIIGTIAPTLFQ